MNYKDVIAKFKPDDEDLNAVFKKADGSTLFESICTFNPIVKKSFAVSKPYRPLSL